MRATVVSWMRDNLCRHGLPQKSSCSLYTLMIMVRTFPSNNSNDDKMNNETQWQQELSNNLLCSQDAIFLMGWLYLFHELCNKHLKTIFSPKSKKKRNRFQFSPLREKFPVYILMRNKEPCQVVFSCSQNACSFFGGGVTNLIFERKVQVHNKHFKQNCN